MKRKILALLLVVVLSIAVLSSCAQLEEILGSLTGTEHQHEFSDEWSKNETHHWHEATCEHTDEKSDEAEHSYVDGVCVCGAEEPTYRKENQVCICAKQFCYKSKHKAVIKSFRF